eukprot:GEMP01045528.1.p1 GENE.GEMP01045528.1~~GEMP01045528.1.p1  ORF type:complete len:352 (+),score=6.79 GEMP01045528.1:40-1095(+)
MTPSLACSAPAFRWWTTTHRLLPATSFSASTLQLPQRVRQLSTLRSWSDIGILDLQTFRQQFATKTEDLFSNSVFNVDMAINKRAEFARNEIGLRAFTQHSKHSVEHSEIDVKSSHLYYHPSQRRFSFQWLNVFCGDEKPVVLVGFLPDEVKVWLWDNDVVAAFASGTISLAGEVDATCEEFDQSPGQFIANMNYDDDEAWHKFGFETDFKETLARYQTKGEQVYAKTPFKGLSLVAQYKLFSEISHRILDFFPSTRKLSHRVLPRSSRLHFYKRKNVCELHFMNILTDEADYALLLPYYPDRVEAYLCKKKEILYSVTEGNRLFFSALPDEQGLPEHIKLPGRLLASLPF